MKDLPILLEEDVTIAHTVHALTEKMLSSKVIWIWQGISLAHLAFCSASERAGKKFKDLFTYAHINEIFDESLTTTTDYPGVRHQFLRDGRVSALRDNINKKYEGKQREEMMEGAFRLYLLLHLE